MACLLGLGMVTVHASISAQEAPLQILEQRRAQERQEQLQQRIDTQQRQLQQQADTATRALQVPQTDPHARLPQEEHPCFPIREVVFAGPGGEPVPEPLLRALDQALDFVSDAQGGPWVADRPVGRCLGAQGINVLLQRTQNRLIDRGYITSRVLAPAQNLASGKLVLTVVAGRIAAIRMEPGIAPEQAGRAGLTTGIPTAPGRILNLRDIEQGLENLKRVPTADADIQIAPAQEVSSAAMPFGQSDLLVRYQQSRPVRLNLALNDSGTDNTGKYQATATLSIDNPLALNDLFYVSYGQDLGGGKPDASGSRGTRNGAAYYSIPFGYWTLGVDWNRSAYHQTVAGATQTYSYSGDQENIEAFVSRLLYRDSSRRTSVTLKGWARNSHNSIDDTEIDVQRRQVGGWAAQLSHREYVGKASLDLTLGYKRGTGAFHSLPAPEETFGEGSSRFGLITAEAVLDVPFHLGTQNLRYSGNWRWQQNRTPLTPQDRFMIGGRYTVRGFDGSSVLLGDRGWLLRNDWGAALGRSGQELYVGLDYGHVGGPSTANLIGNSLAGAVLGLRGNGRGWARGFGYDVFLGTPLYKPAGFKADAVTGGFSLNWAF